MTQEDKIKIAKLIRQETGCGLRTAQVAFDTLLTALKHQPVVLDNPPALKCIWEYDK